MNFSIEFLPATYGDSIWITYGEKNSLHHILVDGGTGGTARTISRKFAALPEKEQHLELLVITHVDRDHIEGILKILEQETLPNTVSDVWFNGWHHLSSLNTVEEFGAVQGERLSTSIIKHKLPWNKAFDHNAVVVPESGELPRISLAGGMQIILLSPYSANLQKLRPIWEKEVTLAGLVPGMPVPPKKARSVKVESFGLLLDVDALDREAFTNDTAPGNGSSIGFLANYGGKSVLFAGDTWPDVICRSLNKLTDDPLEIDLLKVSHHASAGNTSPQLIEKLKCKRYVVSTNGAIYHHPSTQTIARIIKRSVVEPELHFNYHTPYTEPWDQVELKDRYHYRVFYGDGKPMKIDLMDESEP